jgi:hypothetical protein
VVISSCFKWRELYAVQYSYGVGCLRVLWLYNLQLIILNTYFFTKQSTIRRGIKFFMGIFLTLYPKSAFSSKIICSSKRGWYSSCSSNVMTWPTKLLFYVFSKLKLLLTFLNSYFHFIQGRAILHFCLFFHVSLYHNRQWIVTGLGPALFIC